MTNRQHAAQILLRCANDNNISIKDSFVQECTEYNLDEDNAYDLWDQVDELLDEQAAEKFKNV